MEKILLDYLKKHAGEWIKKVQLYLVSDEAGYSPETCGRVLRELEESGKIRVDYYKGKFAPRLARYAFNPPKEIRRTVEIINDVPHIVYK